MSIAAQPRPRSASGELASPLSFSAARSYDSCEVPPPSGRTSRVVSNRKCVDCGTTETPQWRQGPLGPQTLCNACGVRYGRVMRKQKGIKRKPSAQLVSPAHSGGPATPDESEDRSSEDTSKATVIAVHTPASYCSPPVTPSMPKPSPAPQSPSATTLIPLATTNRRNKLSSLLGGQQPNLQGGPTSSPASAGTTTRTSSGTLTVLPPPVLASAAAAGGAGMGGSTASSVSDLDLEGDESEAALNLLSIAAGEPRKKGPRAPRSPRSPAVHHHHHHPQQHPVSPVTATAAHPSCVYASPTMAHATPMNVYTPAHHLSPAALQPPLNLGLAQLPGLQSSPSASTGVLASLLGAQVASMPAALGGGLHDLDLMSCVAHSDKLRQILPTLSEGQREQLRGLCQGFDTAYKALVAAHAARDAVGKILASQQYEAATAGARTRLAVSRLVTATAEAVAAISTTLYHGVSAVASAAAAAAADEPGTQHVRGVKREADDEGQLVGCELQPAAKRACTVSDVEEQKEGAGAGAGAAAGDGVSPPDCGSGAASQAHSSEEGSSHSQACGEQAVEHQEQQQQQQ